MLWLLLRAQVSPAVVAGGAQREARSRDASCRAVSWSAQVQFLHQQKGLCFKTSSSEHMSDLHFEHPPTSPQKGRTWQKRRGKIAAGRDEKKV